MSKLKKKVKGFSLAEILLSMAIFGMLTSSVIFGAFDSNRINKNNYLRITSTLYFEEYFNAIMDNKNSLWASLVNNTNAGPKSLSYTGERYVIVDGAATKDGISIAFEVTDIYRDSNGNVVTNGGTNDIRSRKIHITGTYRDIYGGDLVLGSDIFVNDWNTLELVETTKAEFDDGVHSETITKTLEGGEVQLGYIIYPDWCKPTIALNEFDLPGSAVSKTVFGVPGKAYLGTEGTTTTAALTKVNITGVDNPTIQIEGSYDGVKVNNIFIVGNYALLATQNTSKEVIILDVSHTPYTEVGTFNATGTTVANSVYVEGSVGYVATGRKVQTFDLGSYIGARPKLGEVTMSTSPNFGKSNVAAVSQIIVKNGYIYGSLYEDYYELAIANATNPSNMTVTSLTSFNNQQAYDLGINNAGTRIYMGTGASSSEREFYVLNTSSKTGARPVVASYETNGMSVKGIALIEADKKVVLVGTGGEEYQAVNLDVTPESAITKCGGWNFDAGIYDIDAVTDSYGNAFSYLVTGDIAKEFKILRGGPGGGHADGYGFPPNGNYTSSIMDSGSVNPIYYTVRWTGTIPANTNLKLQLKTGTSIANINSKPFVGPDSTGSSYFTSQDATVLPSSFSGNQYIQYKIFFESDTYSTAVLKDITINYQK